MEGIVMTKEDKQVVIDVLTKLQDEVEAKHAKIQADIEKCPTIDLLVERTAVTHEKIILTTAMLRVSEID